jgi:hypothetical protein
MPASDIADFTDRRWITIERACSNIVLTFSELLCRIESRGTRNDRG